MAGYAGHLTEATWDRLLSSHQQPKIQHTSPEPTGQYLAPKPSALATPMPAPESSSESARVQARALKRCIFISPSPDRRSLAGFPDNRIHQAPAARKRGTEAAWAVGLRNRPSGRTPDHARRQILQ